MPCIRFQLTPLVIARVGNLTRRPSHQHKFTPTHYMPHRTTVYSLPFPEHQSRGPVMAKFRNMNIRLPAMVSVHCTTKYVICSACLYV